MRDPGLQPERTALAWNRTALAAVINACLLLRSGMEGLNPALLLGAGCLIAVASSLMLIGSVSERALSSATVPRAPAPSRMLLAAGSVVLGCGLAAVSFMSD